MRDQLVLLVMAEVIRLIGKYLQTLLIGRAD